MFKVHLVGIGGVVATNAQNSIRVDARCFGKLRAVAFEYGEVDARIIKRPKRFI